MGTGRISPLLNNYKHTSVLPLLSKTLERLFCRYREGHSTQHALLRLVQNCKKSLEQKMNTGAAFIEPSKAFDCFDQLIVKTRCIWVHKTNIKNIQSDLRNRKQQVKMNGSYSEWRNINHGGPQGSVLSLLLLVLTFTIYSCLYQIVESATM